MVTDIETTAVPALRKEDIEIRAEAALRYFAPRIFDEPAATPVVEFAEAATRAVGASLSVTSTLGVNSRGEKLLGACYFAPTLAIHTDISLLAAHSAPRFRFTLAHELGHLSLHRKLPIDFQSLDATSKMILDGRRDLRLGKRRLTPPRDWLEWQAKYYAACVLLPRATFVGAVERWQREGGIRNPGHIYLDDQEENVEAYRILASHLAELYQASRSSVRIRLDQLGCVTDRRQPKESSPTPSNEMRSVAVVLVDALKEFIERVEENERQDSIRANDRSG